MRAGPSPGNDDKVSILLPYNRKIWRPLNLAKRSELATYIFGDFKFWQLHIALPRVHTHTSRTARQLDIIIIILLVNLKFGDRLFNRQITKSPN